MLTLTHRVHSELANDGQITLSPGQVVTWTYKTCAAWIVNNLSENMVYCTDNDNRECSGSSWGYSAPCKTLNESIVAGVIQYLAFNCQGTTGDNGGSCHFEDNPYVGTSILTFPLLLKVLHVWCRVRSHPFVFCGGESGYVQVGST